MKIKVFAIFLLAICIFGFRSSVMVYADNSFQICLIGQGCYYATPDSAEICGTIEFFDKDKSNAESLAKEYF